jgi:hypothetical protein
MDKPATILDYASPRKRRSLRLPADSRHVVAVEDGRLEGVETLTGRRQAMAAVAFAGIAALLTMHDFRLHRFHGDPAVAVSFVAQFLIGSIVLLGCIPQTWRRTRLTVGRGKPVVR